LKAPDSTGYVTFVLHAHLPYVVNHGSWPHGMEWLLEAAAETYLPLLTMLGRLERDGVRARFNLNLSPILLEQLVHPAFRAEFPLYCTRKMVAAKEDEGTFTLAGEPQYAETARFWQRFYAGVLGDFERFGGNLTGEFGRLGAAGVVELITGAATHGYMPLLGTDESVRAQIRMAMAVHERHFGVRPKGIWLAEFGYRPAGYWAYPVGDGTLGGFERIGVEQAVAESGLGFFFVDTHLIEESERGQSPYGGGEVAETVAAAGPRRSIYRAYEVAGDYPVAVFPRDPKTGVQVWSGELGYPGDGAYLDFHKKRYPGGLRYWEVTGARVGMGDKKAYWAQNGAERVRVHAEHFVGVVREALGDGGGVLCAPFDAELFGHWWFEGVMWLEAVCRLLDGAEGLELVSCPEYLAGHRPAGCVAMHEGSWGAGGGDQVWLNPVTSWTYAELYPAEIYLREVCGAGVWRGKALGERILKQMCRELMLLEASDWQFLMTTGAARDYAEVRFGAHRDQFQRLREIYDGWVLNGMVDAEDLEQVAKIEERDGVFPEIDPGWWVAGAKDSL
jgi:1,4-alpha-glucan branching enzyme